MTAFLATKQISFVFVTQGAGKSPAKSSLPSSSRRRGNRQQKTRFAESDLIREFMSDDVMMEQEEQISRNFREVSIDVTNNGGSEAVSDAPLVVVAGWYYCCCKNENSSYRGSAHPFLIDICDETSIGFVLGLSLSWVMRLIFLAMF